MGVVLCRANDGAPWAGAGRAVAGHAIEISDDDILINRRGGDVRGT